MLVYKSQRCRWPGLFTEPLSGTLSSTTSTKVLLLLCWSVATLSNVSWNSQDVDLWDPSTMIYSLQSLCPRTSLETPLFLRLQSQSWDWTEEKNGKYLPFLVIEPTQKSTSHGFLFLLSKLLVPRFLRGCGPHKSHLNFWKIKASVLLNIHKYLLVGINILEWCITLPVIISCNLLNKGTGN